MKVRAAAVLQRLWRTSLFGMDELQEGSIKCGCLHGDHVSQWVHSFGAGRELHALKCFGNSEVDEHETSPSWSPEDEPRPLW